MAKDLEKSRPEGAPKAPHPWSKSSHPEQDITYQEDNVILKRLSSDLESVKKDIDLNYRRLYFKNPMVTPLLTMMQEQLESMIKVLGVPKNYIGEERKESKFNFGVSEEDLT